MEKIHISRFLNSGFPDFQIYRFPNSKISTWMAGRGGSGRTGGTAWEEFGGDFHIGWTGRQSDAYESSVLKKFVPKIHALGFVVNSLVKVR